MKKNLLILAALPVAAFCALGRYIGPTSDPIPTMEGPADPASVGDPSTLYNGTLVSSVWASGQQSSGASISVEVKWADGSFKPNTKWSLDANPTQWSIGTTVTGVSCAPHSIHFHVPSGNSGPTSPHNFSCNSTNDDQKRVVTIRYQ